MSKENKNFDSEQSNNQNNINDFLAMFKGGFGLIQNSNGPTNNPSAEFPTRPAANPEFFKDVNSKDNYKTPNDHYAHSHAYVTYAGILGEDKNKHNYLKTNSSDDNLAIILAETRELDAGYYDTPDFPV